MNDYYHLSRVWRLIMELTSWFKRLCREDDLLVGELELSFLGVDTTVEICFIQRGKAPSRIQIETINGYLQHLVEIHSAAANSIYAQYNASLADYRRAFTEWGSEPDEFAPFLSKAYELAPLLTYQSLFIQDAETTGEFGMGFWSKWEQEHGVGVKFVNWELQQVDENSIHYQ